MARNKKDERLPAGKMYWQIVIDQKLQRRFKAKCIEAGKTMYDQVEELVRNFVK
ncbi:MAG: plasmid partition protein ParG [Candidatus Acidiferrales bacterium]